MAGQHWFGQLEGRIRQAVEELTVGKKLIWYIPDLLQLARSGTHQGQSASMLDQILPGDHGGPAGGLDRSDADRHRAAAAGAAGAAQHLRGGPAGAAVGGGHVVARARGRAASGRRAAHADRARTAPPSRSPRRGNISAPTSFPGSALLLIKLTASRAGKRGAHDRAGRRAQDAVATHRPAGLDPRQQGTPRPRRDPAVLRRAA